MDKVFYVPAIFYVAGLIQHDALAIRLAVGAWACFYLVSVPFVARRVALRSPPGDFLRATAILAGGALPWSLYIPLWRQLTTPTALLVAYPTLLVWCCVAFFMALRRDPPALTPARRLFVLGGGAVLYGAIALISLGGAAFTLLLMASGVPPTDVLLVGLIVSAAGGALGALSGWAALRLWAAKDVPIG